MPLLYRERVQLIFNEKDRAAYEHQVNELHENFGPLDQLPVRVEVRRGEAGRDSERLHTELNAWGQPILGVFDIWGNVNTPFSVMGRIAANPSSEVIVTFGPNWFSRRKELNEDIVDGVFGGRQYWTHEPQHATARRCGAPGWTATARLCTVSASTTACSSRWCRRRGSRCTSFSAPSTAAAWRSLG
jgi:three-Cys-motif partner protein